MNTNNIMLSLMIHAVYIFFLQSAIFLSRMNHQIVYIKLENCIDPLDMH